MPMRRQSSAIVSGLAAGGAWRLLSGIEGRSATPGADHARPVGGPLFTKGGTQADAFARPARRPPPGRAGVPGRWRGQPRSPLSASLSDRARSAPPSLREGMDGGHSAGGGIACLVGEIGRVTVQGQAAIRGDEEPQQAGGGIGRGPPEAGGAALAEAAAGLRECRPGLRVADLEDEVAGGTEAVDQWRRSAGRAAQARRAQNPQGGKARLVGDEDDVGLFRNRHDPECLGQGLGRAGRCVGKE